MSAEASGLGVGTAASVQVDTCLQFNQSILQILFLDEVGQADVADFLGAVQQVDLVLRRIAQDAYYTRCMQRSLSLQIFLKSLEKLISVLREYSEMLTQLYQAQQLVKVLNSVNLRRRLEQLNGSLLTEVSILEEKHAYLGREIGELQSDPHSSSFADVRNPDSSVGADIPILDEEGRRMWQTCFGGTFMVDWPKFHKAFTGTLKTTLSSEQKKVVKQILDNNNTGHVSAAKFSEFLRGFGPFRQSLRNVDQLLAQPWFFGFMTMDEARKFLEFQPVNTYLVRFSGTKPGSFALAFASGPQRVAHVHITTVQNGFSVKQQDEEKVFNNLYEIVDFYSTVLKVPFKSMLPYETWFHGDIDSAQADKYLQGKKVGTFLIRFSSQPGYFAGSYVDETNQVGKCLIASSPRFYIADNEGSQYGQFDSMSDLVRAFSTIFKFPYKKGTNDQQEQMRGRIATEILETEKTYSNAMRTVVDVFMREFDPVKSAKIIAQDEFEKIFSNTPALAAAHSGLVRQLEPIISNFQEDSKFGSIFIEFERQLTVYIPYVNNYNTSMATLTRCMARPPFKKLMDQLLMRPDVGQNNYTAFTIQPIQRVPRYILLLSDLLKHTDDDHPDYDELTQALDAIKISADDINAQKRAADEALQLQDMNDRLRGSAGFNDKVGVAVIHDGELKERDGKKYSDRVCWLLEDCLVIAKPAKKSKKDAGPTKCTFNKEIPLLGAYVQDIPDSKTDKCAFKVTAGGTEIVLAAERHGGKQMWIQKLQSSIDELKAGKKPMHRSSTMTIVQRGLQAGAPSVQNAFGSESPVMGGGSPGSSGGSIPSAVQSPVGGFPLQRSVSVGSGFPGAPAPKNPPSFQSIAGRGLRQSSGPATGPGSPGRATPPPVSPRPPSGSMGPLSSSAGSGSPMMRSSSNLEAGLLPVGWKEAHSADGRLYYYNTVTKKTSWQFPTSENPASAQSPPAMHPPPPEPMSEDWKEARTAEGKVYWYNVVTKETSWRKP